MRRVCAWCGMDLDGDGVTVEADAIVSHGICAECHDKLSEDTGIPVSEFVSSLSEPVVLLDAEHTVGMANYAALKLLGAPATEVLGDRLGSVFDCENAHEPGGCGRTIHCSGCTIRQAVASTNLTGEPKLNIPATLHAVRDPGRSDIELLVSTVKVGDRVLLKIESYREQPETPEEMS